MEPFTATVPFAAGTQPAAIVASDFDNDLAIDLAVVNRDAGTVSILLNNRDVMPTIGGQDVVSLSITDVTSSEGNSGGIQFDFEVTLSEAALVDVTVDYATADDTALLSDNDYQQNSGSLTFIAGQTSKFVTVTVNGDNIDEADERFYVNLSNANGATIAKAQGVGTIIDDELNLTVNSTTDEVDNTPGNGIVDTTSGAITLRAAIMESNARAGDQVITLPAGTYVLNVAGMNEAVAASGDLDVTDDLTINGVGASSTFIDANQIDRVFDLVGAHRLTITGVTIRNGRITGITELGGGIRNTNGTLELQNVTLTGNSTEGHGGAISNNGTLTVDASRIANNSAITGGGLENELGGVATITNSTILTNTATSGGGIYVGGGSVVVDSSTISGNTGNGITVYKDTTITNSTISGNSGYGIFLATNNPAVVLNVTSSTITANTNIGFNASVGASNKTLKNSIVAQNLGSADVANDLTSLGNNLIGNVGTATGLVNGVNGDQVGSTVSPLNAQLLPLADYGGPTFTHALLPASPAIDVGNGTGAPATDQRGLTRPQDGDNNSTATVDIGAFELEFNAAPVLVDTILFDMLPVNVSLNDNVGMSVNDLVGGMTDANTLSLRGIAITATNETNGILQYSVNGGNSWTIVGAVNPSNALLLAADGKTRVRFRPAVNFEGTVADAITFRAWDRTQGVAGTKSDATSNGGMTPFSLNTDTFEIVVTGTFWDGGGADNLWATAANWSNNTAPNSNSSVLIDVPGDVTVVINDVRTVSRLLSRESLRVTNSGVFGRLTVTGGSQSRGSLSLEEGTSLIANGAVASWNSLGAVTFYGADLTAVNGGKLWFPTATIYQGVSGERTVIAKGAGSLIDLSSLTSITGSNGADCGGCLPYATNFVAEDGGQLDLSAVTVTANKVRMKALGADSLVNLNSLHTMETSSGRQDFEGSQIIVNAPTARVFVPVLDSVTSVGMNVTGGGTLDLSSLSSYTGEYGDRRVVADGVGSRIELTGLTNIMGSTGAGCGNCLPYAADFFASNGGTIDLSNVTATADKLGFMASGANSMVNLASLRTIAKSQTREDYEGTRIEVDGATAQVFMPVIESLASVGMRASGGATLDLSNATSYVGGGGNRAITATGSLSRVDLTGLTQLTASSGDACGICYPYVLDIAATAGGQVDLSSVTTVTDKLRLDVRNATSEIRLNALQTYPGAYVPTQFVGTYYQTINVQDGGRLTLGPATQFNGPLWVTANSGTLEVGTLGLSGSVTLQGTVQGNLNVSGTLAIGGTTASASPSTLTVTGDYTQLPTGTLQVELSGTTAGTEYDQLNINGQAALAGTVAASLFGGFVPEQSAVFEVLQFGSRVGDFGTKNLNLGSGLGLIPAFDSNSLNLTTAFFVTSTNDSVDNNPGDGLSRDASGNSTLRAAIMEANARPGDDVISLPAGTYTLSIAGTGEDAAATGDLDITGNLTLIGAGWGQTTIDANQIDRVFHVLPGVSFDLRGVTVTRGDATGASGGGIRNQGTLTIERSAIVGNSATDDGGGIRNDGGDLTVIDSTIGVNAAGGLGGGIFNTASQFRDGMTIINNSTLSANTAVQGGAIHSASTLRLTNATISGNTATGSGGGGIRLLGPIVATSSTITNNTATGAAGAGAGGGILDESGLPAPMRVFTSTIVAGNTSANGDHDLSGTFSSNGGNLIGNVGSSSGFVNGMNDDQVGGGGNPVIDARLAPLADNGGLADTHALLPGSPAIDRGKNLDALTTEQRGLARTVDLAGYANATNGDGTDIGALEYDGSAFFFADRAAFEAPWGTEWRWITLRLMASHPPTIPTARPSAAASPDSEMNLVLSCVF